MCSSDLEEAEDRQFWEKRGISRILAVGVKAEGCGDIQALMESTGVRLEAAASVEEAAGRLRDGMDYQLALLDWESCGPRGAEALRAALPKTVPMLLLAEFGAEGVEEVRRMECSDILTKPFFVSAFREKIEEMRGDPLHTHSPEPADTVSLEGLRFLAAEDNEINAEILEEILAIEGASCELVENGRLAVERFQRAGEGEFDAILMDVQMPVMNGHEAARAIRALEREDAGRIPIIAMTANAFSEDEKAALDAGMDAHVAKPLNMDLLKKVIRQCVRRKEDL